MNTRYCLFLLLIGILYVTGPVSAQTNEKPKYALVDSLISDLYESISFRDTTDLDWKTFRDLFIGEGMLIPAQSSDYVAWTVEEYIFNFISQVKNGRLKRFREWEIARTTNRYGKMLHLFSTYRTEFATEESPEGKSAGINSIQIIKYQGRWWIVSIVWDNQREDNPIPDKYLNNN